MKRSTRVKVEVPSFRVQKSDEGLSTLSGYAAVFNSTSDLGWFTESIAQGAFVDSIARGDDVRALFNHNPNFVLGRTKSKTLTLKEDEKGLFCEIVPPDTQVGRDLVALIERGDISQMSFGFYIDEEEVRHEPGKPTHFTITRATLFDVSPVTFPAYEDTEIEVQRHIRSRTEQRENIAKAAFDFRKREIELLRN